MKIHLLALSILSATFSYADDCETSFGRGALMQLQGEKFEEMASEKYKVSADCDESYPTIVKEWKSALAYYTEARRSFEWALNRCDAYRRTLATQALEGLIEVQEQAQISTNNMEIELENCSPEE